MARNMAGRLFDLSPQENQTTYQCPNCSTPMIRHYQGFYFRGTYWPGLVCLQCGGLWEDPSNHWGMTPLNENLVEQSKTQPK